MTFSLKKYQRIISRKREREWGGGGGRKGKREEKAEVKGKEKEIPPYSPGWWSDSKSWAKCAGKNCEINAEFSFLLQWKDAKHFHTFLLHNFCQFSHCTIAWSRSWSQGKCQRQGPLFSDRDSRGNSPSLADPGWAPCQESTTRASGRQLSLNGMLRAFTYPTILIACFCSEYRQEGKNNKYSQLPEICLSPQCISVFQVDDFYFSIFHCFVCIAPFLMAVSKYHFGESFMFRTVTVPQRSQAQHKSLDLVSSCCFLAI